ncbi:MAG: BMP family ABC transporter substrate-binding protein, partial [Oscillospiraceae bacterium]|nr:BMP family ABC transporter substrate-binding protein [Oscillospiraceae bacterium]
EEYKGGKEVYSVGNNEDMTTFGGEAVLTSPVSRWSVYYAYAMESYLGGGEIESDWCHGADLDAVGFSAVGSACAEGTQEKLAELEKALKSGELEVFATDGFTVSGAALESFTVTVGGQEQEAVFDGAFHESYFCGAPYFDRLIDGVSELTW